MWVSRGIEQNPQNGGQLQAAVVDAWAVHGIWWIRKTLGSIPGGTAPCFFFSSDPAPAVSSSIFVGAEREEDLIRNERVYDKKNELARMEIEPMHIAFRLALRLSNH